MSEPRPDPAMHETEFLFRVGMAVGRAFAPPSPPAPTIPALAAGQTEFYVWSAPIWPDGYRQLLTFRLVESVR